MAIVSAEKFVQAARDNGYAVGGFNTNNLEWTQAILRAAEAVSYTHLRYLGLLLATVVMVGGYALASALFLGNGWGAAISDIPNNLAQNFVGMALGLSLIHI